MDIYFEKGDTFRIKNKTASVEISESVTLTNNLTEVKKEIKGPGEYEVAGVSVIGFKNNIYVYEFERLRLCSVGQLTGNLSENTINEIGDIDVLIVNEASKEVESLISKIEPYFVVIPQENFLKDTGITAETMSKFSLKKEEIIEDQNAKIIVLEKK